MAETDIKTIRIELPYVKIGPSEDPSKFETYNSAGLFFVEFPNGDFQVADVVGENLGVGLWGLPPSSSVLDGALFRGFTFWKERLLRFKTSRISLPGLNWMRTFWMSDAR